MKIYLLVGARYKRNEGNPYMIFDPSRRVFKDKQGVLKNFKKEQLLKGQCTGYVYSHNKKILKLYYKNGSYEIWGLIPQIDTRER